MREADPGKKGNNKVKKKERKTQRKKKKDKKLKKSNQNRDVKNENKKGKKLQERKSKSSKKKDRKKTEKKKQKKRTQSKNIKNRNRNKGKNIERRRKNNEAKKTQNKKSGKKKKTRNNERQSCASTTCMSNINKYMKMLSGRVKNFGKQKARVATSMKQAAGKANKMEIFKPLIAQIRSAGGGNASELKCNGDSSSPGAEQLNTLTAQLTACEADINQTCTADLPEVNQTMIDSCAMYMEAFENITTEAIAEAGAASCVLWEAQELADAAADLAGCDLSTLNAEFTTAKKECTKAL